MSTHPFEDDGREYLVLRNDVGQHSLWPAGFDVPAGWSVVHGPASRRECLDLVDAVWQDLTPARCGGAGDG